MAVVSIHSWYLTLLGWTGGEAGTPSEPYLYITEAGVCSRQSPAE